MEMFPFGRTADGQEVQRYRLTGAGGAYVDVLNYGGVIQSLVVPDRGGRLVDVVLGFDSVAEYETDDAYIGALIGRWAGRISGAAFELNGHRRQLAANDGPNHLHGGRMGFNQRIWTASAEGETLVLSRLSPDGEEGYPGALAVKVRYCFDEENQLALEYEAECDRDTVVNLTNHSYFNLNGAGRGDILDHQLAIAADYIAEIDPRLIPTGRLLPVSGTPFDFNAARPVGQFINAAVPQLEYGGGYDHYYVRSQVTPGRPAAWAFSPDAGIRLDVFTTEPGLQFYTGNYLKRRAGKAGASYGPRSGFCLETQFWPDAPNQLAFPAAILKRGTRYRQTAAYKFGLTG